MNWSVEETVIDYSYLKKAPVISLKAGRLHTENLAGDFENGIQKEF